MPQINIDDCDRTLGSLLKEALDHKHYMAVLKNRLDAINKEVARRAVFKEGCKTATMAEDNVMAKVQLKETVSWNQDGLKKALDVIGADEFRKVFTYEFKSLGARQLNAWLADPTTKDEWRTLISECRQVKPGNPSVSYEDVSAEGE